MADKSTQLILTALSQAAAAPDGLPLYATRAVAGLFPATAAGKQAAQRCLDEGHLRLLVLELPLPMPDSDTATAVRKKTRTQERVAVTDKGLAYLLGQVSPRQVLEDLVRTLETRQGQVEELCHLARAMNESLAGLRANADRVLQHVRQTEAREPGTPPPGGLNALYNGFRKDAAPRDLSAELVGLLTRWQPSSAAEDCPLPELFRQAQAAVPGTSIGHFHDGLRRLHDGGQIFLHPWTGPLYDIPEPPYALLVGHEVAYYASIRK